MPPKSTTVVHKRPRDQGGGLNCSGNMNAKEQQEQLDQPNNMSSTKRHKKLSSNLHQPQQVWSTIPTPMSDENHTDTSMEDMARLPHIDNNWAAQANQNTKKLSLSMPITSEAKLEQKGRKRKQIPAPSIKDHVKVKKKQKVCKETTQEVTAAEGAKTAKPRKINKGSTKKEQVIQPLKKIADGINTIYKDIDFRKMTVVKMTSNAILLPPWNQVIDEAVKRLGKIASLASRFINFYIALIFEGKERNVSPFNTFNPPCKFNSEFFDHMFKAVTYDSYVKFEPSIQYARCLFFHSVLKDAQVNQFPELDTATLWSEIAKTPPAPPPQTAISENEPQNKETHNKETCKNKSHIH